MHEWLMAAGTVAAIVMVVVAILAWLFPRGRRTETVALPQGYTQYRLTKLPALIHATSGVPCLKQLKAGMEPDAGKENLAERLYEIGLEQFNHYVNNRDGIIEKSRLEMESLANHLSESEISLAEGVARSLVTATDEEERDSAQKQYELLSPQCQSYADHKGTEIDIERRNVRDFFKNVPRTDYTAVKSRIASGAVRLESVLDDLPIPWQEIRTLNDEVERPRFLGKPPKREFLHVIFMTREWGKLEDRRAEKDGDWIISDKHDMITPYQDPVPQYRLMEQGKPPVLIGEVVIINQDPLSEWDTEFWRQGGHLDQSYLRAKNGTLPEQLWRAYRRRQVNRIGWIAGTAILIADIILFVTLYL